MATTADPDLQRLRAEVDRLRKRRSLLRTVILADQSTISRLTRAKNVTKDRTSHARVNKLLELARTQQRNAIENAHYAAAGITPLHIHDPDPNAVDGGAVFGLRLDVFDTENDQFLDPYYVFLHRPDPSRKPTFYRVHKHTVPEDIDLHHLEDRWLAATEAPPSGFKPFGDAVRSALLVRQSRINLVKKLARDARDARGIETDAEETRVRIASVASETLGRTIDVEWDDGSVGSVIITDDGMVQDAVVHEPTEDSQIPAPKRHRVGRAIKGDGQSAAADQMVERLLLIGWA